MSRYDVVIKHVEAFKIASVCGVVPTPPEQGGLWDELGAYLAAKHVRPIGLCLSLYHDDEAKERDWDIEVCEPLEAHAAETHRVKMRELPDVASMACVVHHGPFTTIGEAYNAISKWIGENGYHTTGPSREVYIKPARNGSQTDPDTVTEIQFPVEKG